MTVNLHQADKLGTTQRDGGFSDFGRQKETPRDVDVGNFGCGGEGAPMGEEVTEGRRGGNRSGGAVAATQDGFDPNFDM